MKVLLCADEWEGRPGREAPTAGSSGASSGGTSTLRGLLEFPALPQAMFLAPPGHVSSVANRLTGSHHDTYGAVS